MLPQEQLTPVVTSVHGGFPSSLTSLIGRETDVAAVLASLGEHARLVTLTGPGGVGKTRLALRIGEEAASGFANGVVFVSLAMLTTPDLVLPTIAWALGLRDAGDQPLLEVVARFLHRAHLLLVLDNFEQVLPAAASVATLLARCPGVDALVTSRAPLRVTGEQRFSVAPLALPPPMRVGGRGDAALTAAAASPAVQLFVARAQGVDPTFVLHARNAETVAAICRRLDGLPLAIELAAARAYLLEPSELLSRLRPALPHLDGGPSDAPDRLRTMRNAIAWSFDLLTAEEQRLFRRLGVFAGGFTLEAAESVAAGRRGAGAPGPREDDDPASSASIPRWHLEGTPLTPFNLIASLVDASLLRRTVAQGESRFAMLETIREFALESLESSGEAESARRAHALWCVRLAEDVLAHIHGPEGPAALDRLETEHDNLRAALSWTIAAGETELALRLAYAAWRLWWMHSLLEEGRTWLERALALPDTGPATTALRPMTQVAAGYFARVQGDYARASALGVEALALAQQTGDAHGASGALHLLSLTATDCGNLAEAQAHLEAGIAIDRSVDYAHGVAFGLSNLGDVALARGLLDDAAAFADEALAIWRDRGDAWSVAWAQIGCGRIARAQGDPARAVSLVCDGLATCAKLGDKEIAARGISELAAIAAERGELRLAARLYGSVAALREAIGAPLAPTERAGHDEAVDAIRAGLLGNAFAAAWEAGRALSLDQAVTEAAALTHAASRTNGNGASATDLLTSRQHEVLRLLARGWSDKEIAAVLFISSRTVSAHVATILTKLGAPSRSAAVAIAVRDCLV